MATFVTGKSLAVDGLNETIRGLKKVRPELGKVATRANKSLTTRIMLPAARQNWRSQRIRPSVADQAVVAAAGQTWAGLRTRYRKFGFGAGVVFGSKQYAQFRPWVGNQFTPGQTRDYIVGPAIVKKGEQFSREWMSEVEKAIIEAIR